MPPVGFEPAVSAGKRPKTYALDRAAIGIGGLPRVIGCNSWSSSFVGGSARDIIDILAHTQYFNSKISVIMCINILLKHANELNN
jgi:hypothetical protein